MKNIFFAFILLLIFTSGMFAQSTTKISALDTATTISSTDRFLLTTGGTSKALTFYRLNSLLISSGGLASISGNNAFTGTNVFSGTNYFGAGAKFTVPVLAPTSPGNGTMYYNTTEDKLFIYDDDDIRYDTVASQGWVRSNLPTLSNVVDLTSNQSIYGIKTFQNIVSFGTNGIFALPGLYPEYPHSLWGTDYYLFYGKAGLTGIYDTVMTYSLLRSRLSGLNYSILPTSNNTQSVGNASYRFAEMHARKVYTDSFYITAIVHPDGVDSDIPIFGNITFSDSTNRIGRSGFGGQVGIVYTDTVQSPNSLVLVARDEIKLQGMTILSKDSVEATSTDLDVGTGNVLQIYSSSIQNIDNLIGLTPGKIVYVLNVGTYAITFKDGTGNMEIAGDFTLNPGDTITLMADATFSYWHELSRSDNVTP